MNNMHKYIVNQNQQQEHIFIFDEKTVLSSETTLQFNLEAYATLIVHIVIIDVSAQVKIQCNMQGAGAQAQIYGAYTASDTNIISIETMLYHQAAHTNSSLVMKGVVRDSAQAHYHGTI